MEDGSPILDSLYERDFVAWAETQAEALKSRGAGANALDYDNLAEEIEDVAKHVARTCKSYLSIIIEHLLKLQFGDARYDERGWRASVSVARKDLDDELTPTLRKRLPDDLPRLFATDLELLHVNRKVDGRVVREALPEGYSWSQLTDADWWPEPVTLRRRVIQEPGLEPRSRR